MIHTLGLFLLGLVAFLGFVAALSRVSEDLALLALAGVVLVLVGPPVYVLMATVVHPDYLTPTAVVAGSAWVLYVLWNA